VDVNYKIHVPEVGVKTKTKIIFVNWIESKTKIAVKTELEQKLKWINLELNKSKTKINLETKTSQISPFQLSLSLSLSPFHPTSPFTLHYRAYRGRRSAVGPAPTILEQTEICALKN